MILFLNIYPSWFSDELSKNVSRKLGQKEILVKDWVDLPTLYSLRILPKDFSLEEYAKADKIFGIYFNPPDRSYHDILIHPDSVLRICKREGRRKIRRE